MATEDHKAKVAQVKTTEPGSFDPRDTDHPTGSAQAAENAANEPPA